VKRLRNENPPGKTACKRGRKNFHRRGAESAERRKAKAFTREFTPTNNVGVNSGHGEGRAQETLTAETQRARRKADVRQARGLCFAPAVTLEISSAGRETESSRFFRIHWAALISLRKNKAARTAAVQRARRCRAQGNNTEAEADYHCFHKGRPGPKKQILRCAQDDERNANAFTAGTQRAHNGRIQRPFTTEGTPTNNVGVNSGH